MAVVLVPDENRRIEGAEAIGAFLKPFGIWHERWQLEERVSPDAPADAILEAYKPEIDRLKAQGGYVTADVMQVTPETPNLDAMMEKFKSEHTHAEDEVRFFVEGRGLFCLHLGDEVLQVLCEQNDFLRVPAGTRHWFDMGESPRFTAIRFFDNPEGWVAQFSGDAIAERFPLLD
jgi:1,2-dihydroxy-3-keto-5-methylthiopentene dioxygenase